MVCTTNGIVLSYIKYGETSIIARILTEERGYGSFIVNSIRSKRSKKSIGYFQPFSIVELVLFVKESRDLQRVSEVKGAYPLHSIHRDLTKSSITLFLSEVLSRLLQSEQSVHKTLYQFIELSIRSFDQLETGVENFHLQFLLKIASHLGFAVDEFDTLFTSVDKLAPSGGDDKMIELLINEPYGLKLETNRTIRNHLLDTLLNYYHHHAHMPYPKSLDVLRSVLN